MVRNPDILATLAGRADRRSASASPRRPRSSLREPRPDRRQRRSQLKHRLQQRRQRGQRDRPPTARNPLRKPARGILPVRWWPSSPSATKVLTCTHLPRSSTRASVGTSRIRHTRLGRSRPARHAAAGHRPGTRPDPADPHRPSTSPTRPWPLVPRSGLVLGNLVGLIDSGLPGVS